MGIVFLCFRYLLGLIWPFAIAFLFSWILTPTIRWFTAKCHIKYNISVILALIIFFAILCGLAVLLISRVITFAADAVTWIPGLYSSTIEPGLSDLFESLENMLERVSPEVAEMVDSAIPTLISSIGSAATSLSMKLVSILSGVATKLPSVLMSTFICVIATVFMTADFPRMTSFLLRQVPDHTRHVIHNVKESLKKVIGKYGRSYGIIMGITFAEMLIGMFILRQDHAFVIAAAIAVFDIFPIVGAGTILIPWGIIALLSGSVRQGVGLLILYIVEVSIRQIIEPRIIGQQIGLHPIITLVSMFVGTKLFGVVGLFGLPISCAIVSSLDSAGVIHFIKHENAPAPATPDVPTSPAEGSSPLISSPDKKTEK